MQADNSSKKPLTGTVASQEDSLIPVVSVIIPTYNRADFIVDAITSVLDQTYTAFEIIVVDDGSIDGTGTIVKEILDPRLVYIKQVNKGRSFARNVALARSRGRYIAFLDSDDLYQPDKLALQVAYLDAHRHVGMVYTSAYCIGPSGEMLEEEYIASVSGYIYSSIAFFHPVTITLPTVMTRRELFDQVGGFDEKMDRFEDTDMWRRLSQVTHIEALPQFTCKLRTHASNSLANQKPDEIIKALDYYAQKIRTEDIEVAGKKLQYGLGGLYYYYGRAFLTIPAWNARALLLLQKSSRYWWPYAFKGLAVWLKYLMINRFRPPSQH